MPAGVFFAFAASGFSGAPDRGRWMILPAAACSFSQASCRSFASCSALFMAQTLPPHLNHRKTKPPGDLFGGRAVSSSGPGKENYFAGIFLIFTDDFVSEAARFWRTCSAGGVFFGAAFSTRVIVLAVGSSPSLAFRYA